MDEALSWLLTRSELHRECDRRFEALETAILSATRNITLPEDLRTGHGHWNGTAWSQGRSPLPTKVRGISTNTGGFIASGEFLSRRKVTWVRRTVESEAAGQFGYELAAKAYHESDFEPAVLLVTSRISGEPQTDESVRLPYRLHLADCTAGSEHPFNRDQLRVLIPRTDGTPDPIADQLTEILGTLPAREDMTCRLDERQAHLMARTLVVAFVEECLNRTT